MPPIPQFWNSADSAQINSGTPISAPVTAGNVIGPTTYHLWNEKGGSTATILHNARLVATVYDGTNRVSDGFAVLDEAWCQVRLTGLANPGDAAMEAQTTGFIPIGRLTLKDIPVNCARYMDVQFVVPGGANNAGYTFFLELRYDELSVILSPLTSLLSRSGIIPDRFDSSNRRMTSGGAVSAPGNDTVIVASRSYVYDGTQNYAPQNTVTLNQNDSVPSALIAGQSYIATLSQQLGSATVTVTKGVRATTPATPAVPSGEILIGSVSVAYRAGGTSVIANTDVSVTGVIFGEFWLSTPPTGLTVFIGAGQSISSLDTEPFQSGPSSLVLPDNATSYVFLNADGTFTRIATNTPPSPSSILISPSGGLITGGGHIIPFNPTANFTHQRAERSISEYTMHLRFYGDCAIGSALAWDVLPYPSILESWDVDFGTAGTGGSANIIDIKYIALGGTFASATTIFTSYATLETRPTINATAPYNGSRRNVGHEVVTFAEGVRFTFDVVQTNTTLPVDCIVSLHFRKI